MYRLAINGGDKIRTEPLPKQITVGEEEKKAVIRVLDSKRLSAYRGCYIKNFWGGPEVRALEEEFCAKMQVKYAIPCNSCTSGIQIALKALDVGGEDVLVGPWSMSCSASAPLIANATPVFVDIDKDYYMLDTEDILKKCGYYRPKAMIMVNLFGQPYDVDMVNTIAKALETKIIEDSAQAIGSTYRGKYSGTLGDIGVFSFTQGKHLTAGEGGMIVTNDEELAMKCRLVMNHSEAVMHDMPKDVYSKYADMASTAGFNMRMTEMQAAILREQLKKLDTFVENRQRIAGILEDKLTMIPFIQASPVREHCTHSYYVQAFKFDNELAGIHRNKFIEAVKAELTPELGRETEGVPIGCGYIEPLNRFPLFDGGTGSTCPNALSLWKDELFLHRLCGFDLQLQDLQDIIDAFYKVTENLKELE